jgi:hypothetical protein
LYCSAAARLRTGCPFPGRKLNFPACHAQAAFPPYKCTADAGFGHHTNLKKVIFELTWSGAPSSFPAARPHSSTGRPENAVQIRGKSPLADHFSKLEKPLKIRHISTKIRFF